MSSKRKHNPIPDMTCKEFYNDRWRLWLALWVRRCFGHGELICYCDGKKRKYDLLMCSFDHGLAVNGSNELEAIRWLTLPEAW